MCDIVRVWADGEEGCQRTVFVANAQHTGTKVQSLPDRQLSHMIVNLHSCVSAFSKCSTQSSTHLCTPQQV